jgi:hypothetical protein
MENRFGISALSVIMVLLMVSGAFFAIVPSKAAADQDGDYTYTVSGGVATITGYTGAGGAITIPSTLGGYITKIIGAYSFSNCSSLTSITIPDIVTTIENGSFYSCRHLTSATLGDNVTTIGDYAFCGCSSLHSLTISDNVTTIGDWAFCMCSLTSIAIPDSVITIGNWTFYDCSYLNSLTIGDNVTTIGDFVFYGCCSLTSITIPDNVTSIEGRLFGGCTSLISVAVGSDVIEIDNSAFMMCSKLTSIDVNAANAVYSSVDGVLYNKALTTLILCPEGKVGSFIIPDGVTTIGNIAFNSCTSLISVSIGTGVTTIGDGAFGGCSGLTSITIPNSVTTIGTGAFNGCNSLISVSLGNGVTMLGSSVFCYCSSLSSIAIPQNVTTIGYRAFEYCTSLTSITFLGLVAPTSVGSYWVDSTNSGLRGHAFATSNFPSPGGIWNGLTMGDVVVSTVPGIPTGLTVIAGNGKVLLNWTAPVGEYAIDYYIIYRDGVDTQHVANITTTIIGLENGQSYSFKVAAHNAFGTGPQSKQVTVSNIIPSAPDGLTYSSSKTSVNLKWDVVSTANSYKVYRGNSNN